MSEFEVVGSIVSAINSGVRSTYVVCTCVTQFPVDSKNRLHSLADVSFFAVGPPGKSAAMPNAGGGPPQIARVVSLDAKGDSQMSHLSAVPSGGAPAVYTSIHPVTAVPIWPTGGGSGSGRSLGPMSSWTGVEGSDRSVGVDTLQRDNSTRSTLSDDPHMIALRMRLADGVTPPAAHIMHRRGDGGGRALSGGIIGLSGVSGASERGMLLPHASWNSPAASMRFSPQPSSYRMDIGSQRSAMTLASADVGVSGTFDLSNRSLMGSGGTWGAPNLPVYSSSRSNVGEPLQRRMSDPPAVYVRPKPQQSARGMQQLQHQQQHPAQWAGSGDPHAGRRGIAQGESHGAGYGHSGPAKRGTRGSRLARASGTRRLDTLEVPVGSRSLAAAPSETAADASDLGSSLAPLNASNTFGELLEVAAHFAGGVAAPASGCTAPRRPRSPAAATQPDNGPAAAAAAACSDAPRGDGWRPAAVAHVRRRPNAVHGPLKCTRRHAGTTASARARRVRRRR